MERDPGRLHSHDRNEVFGILFLYSSSYRSVSDDALAPLLWYVRGQLIEHLKALKHDCREQAHLLRLILSPTGIKLLPRVLAEFESLWKESSSYFWEQASDLAGFSELIEEATTHQFDVIRRNPKALNAVKILILKLAAEQSPCAIEAQQRLGFKLK